MNPLTWRFVAAGAVIAACGTAVMILQQGVGDHPVWKGAILAALGVILGVTGLMRRDHPPEDSPRIFQPEE